MQRDSNKTEQMIPDNTPDTYALSELVLFGLDGSNMISCYCSLLHRWAAAKWREQPVLCACVSIKSKDHNFQQGRSCYHRKSSPIMKDFAWGWY